MNSEMQHEDGSPCVDGVPCPPSGAVQRWADEAMYTAEPQQDGGPRVSLLSMTADPLGEIAAGAAMYTGKVKRSLADVTHEERKYYLAEMQKTKLKAPLELVNLHFLFENVTRAFTHQLVRQRTAVYMQESMRFAVKEDMASAVALPPSLEMFAGGVGAERAAQIWADYDLEGWTPNDPVERQYVFWRQAVETIAGSYKALIALGMPAEDARGLAPTAVKTRVHYGTNLRALLDHAGNRLCTQAQFEWRAVFAGIANAIRNYNPLWRAAEQCRNLGDREGEIVVEHIGASDGWQYAAIAELLQPVCYQVGRCVFEAEFDRHCTIRERVNLNAACGRSSDLWGTDWNAGLQQVPAIRPEEWLADPAAARRA